MRGLLLEVCRPSSSIVFISELLAVLYSGVDALLTITCQFLLFQWWPSSRWAVPRFPGGLAARMRLLLLRALQLCPTVACRMPTWAVPVPPTLTFGTFSAAWASTTGNYPLLLCGCPIIGCYPCYFGHIFYLQRDCGAVGSSCSWQVQKDFVFFLNVDGLVIGRISKRSDEHCCDLLTHYNGTCRCHENASGYWGPWTRAETTFSNEYFNALLNETWTPKKTHNGMCCYCLLLYVCALLDDFQ